MPWYTPNPAAGLPITSAWGNAVQNAAQPAFATLAALQAGWTDAPDGASAFVLADRRTYRRRGGQWLLELQNVQGVAVGRFPGPADNAFNVMQGAPGSSLAGFGPFNLRGKRVYMVVLAGRFQLMSALNNQILGTHLNFMGTGADVPLTWNGGAPEFANGVAVLESAFPMPFQGAVQQGSWTGSLATGGADDQVLAIRAQVVLNGLAGQVAVSEIAVSCIDIGAAQ